MSIFARSAFASLFVLVGATLGIVPSAEGQDPCMTEIGVFKFYDANLDGCPAGELPIEGWHFELWNSCGALVACGLTCADGRLSFWVPMDGGAYVVVETLAGDYINTTPLSAGVTACVARVDTTFGNACVDPRLGLGRTPGFWQSCNNPNGRGIVGCDLLAACDPEWRTLLNDLALVWPDGTALVIPVDAPFAGAFAVLKSWINGKAGGNMAFILSRQLAATALNAHCGPLSLLGGALALDCGDGIEALDGIIAEASALLAANPITVGSSAARCAQQEIKDCLDAANNNTIPFLWVAPEPCAFESLTCCE